MTAITPGKPQIIQMRSSSSNTSIASMTDEMLKEIRTNPIYSNDANVTKLVRETCTAKAENYTRDGIQKNLKNVFKEIQAHLKTKDQMDLTVRKLQEELRKLNNTTPTLPALTPTPIPNQGFGFQLSSIKSHFSPSTRIKEGRVSTSDLETLLSDPSVLENPVVQRRVLKGILRGKIVAEVPPGPGAKLINLMKATVTPMLSANDQADVLQVKEGHDHALGVLLREHPQCIRFFTAPASRRYIASAIRSLDFGNDPEVLKAVAGQLDIFKDPEAQRDIAQAISEYKFGHDSDVNAAVAKQLTIFTDPEANSLITTMPDWHPVIQALRFLAPKLN